MGCSTSILISRNVIDEIKDSERINVKDKYKKVLLLDKSRDGTEKVDKTDTNQEIRNK